MAKKLTASEQTWSRTVLHDIFEAGGLLKFSVRKSGTNRIVNWGYENHAKLICEEIKFRNFDFPKLDTAISTISSRVSFDPISEGGGRRKDLTAAQIANIIANFCAEQEIYWDDINTSRTTVEMDTYRMTVLGKACWEFGCFLSQHTGASTTKTPKTPRAAGTRAPGAAPKSGYKSSGPKSGLIKGLVGKPGEKSKLTSVLYAVVGISTKPKAQYLFVDPLASGSVVNKAKVGDPSGYSACKLFFTSALDAKAAAEKIIGFGEVPSHVSSLEVVRAGADPNGYFLIETTVGQAYIKASKLNEEIMESVDEEAVDNTAADTPVAEKVTRKSKFPEIDDIDTYNEAMQRYE